MTRGPQPIFMTASRACDSATSNNLARMLSDLRDVAGVSGIVSVTEGGRR
jgi:hypothetical protein